MTNELTHRTACDLGRAIGDGTVDAREVTDAFLDAMDTHADTPRIYVRATRDRAMAEADAARHRARTNTRKGILDGVPLSWKDLFNTAGTETEAGTDLLKGNIPTTDAQVLRNATLGGSICLGKTHMTELAFAGLGYNPITATPPNVNDPKLAPGGSSSGAATSVAFGLAAAGIGSDTGGSVRVPSAWNNLVGLKTTAPRLSLKGAVPLCRFFDTVGPLCRTVEDAAALLALLDGTTAPDLTGADVRGQRFLVLENVALEDIRDAPRDAFEDAINRIAAAGGQIVRGSVEAVSHAMLLSALLFSPDAYATQGELIESAPHLMFPEILDRFRAGAEVSAVQYLRARASLAELRAEYMAATAAYDAVLIPTAPITAPEVAKLAADNDYYRAENLMALRNTRIGNLMGTCALQLPTGTPMCGITAMRGPMQEEALLRVGAGLERALAVR
ncbi:aspartyl-tRNA(Asn)/glutamyl-tRNA(Gln) amidotransferase subunit A [Monaibacterium marinum]|uniref:Aspartyl-tRNA(Asn)/glutamyl-tRNA(Gln) amidotransferase subunit A n=1 Tax=Pontivivens marinum TaxID=1690039 RepID=A0A2C9CMZ8_9RHOB|nr:amidase family protein [Monaibacterium marinum]SOH92587.1 aspartyl-tRNA(Asn)/glutamyl-tRNA(Gln) amidotransferase subunit A [Monaibacterium marinum]